MLSPKAYLDMFAGVVAFETKSLGTTPYLRGGAATISGSPDWKSRASGCEPLA
jgi:hypothetical protein